MNTRAGKGEYILQTHSTKFLWWFNGGGWTPLTPPLGTPLRYLDWYMNNYFHFCNLFVKITISTLKRCKVGRAASTSLVEAVDTGQCYHVDFGWFAQFYGCFAHVRESYFARIICKPLSLDHPPWRKCFITSLLLLTLYRRTRLSAIGDRAFPVAASRLWNTLPQNVTSASPMSVLIGNVWTLKTHLFSHSFLSP